MKKYRSWLLFISLTMILLITACGGDSDDSEEGDSASAPITEEATAEITDVPTEAPTIDVTQEVTAEVTAESTAESADSFSAEQNEACPELVRVALAQVAEVCDATQRNQICYGNTDMQIIAQDTIEDITFASPGDITEIGNLQTIQLSPMDTLNELWGIALMRLQANLEGTLAGQNVTFLLFGDVQLENLGEGDDGLQSFYFQSAVGDSQCAEAPESGMLVQTPEGVAQVNLNINDVEIALGSTAFIQAEPEQDMRISVVEGEAAVTSSGETERVFAGTSTTVALDETGYADSAPTEAEAYEIEPLEVLPVSPLDREIIIAPPTLISREDVGVGDVISGELTSPTEIITHDFEVQAGQIIYFDSQGGDGSRLGWRLDDSFGHVLLDATRIDTDLGSYEFEQAGTYTVIISSQNDRVGTYEFQLWEVAESETFNAGITSADASAEPQVYTGTLTTPGTFHEYNFEVTSGQTIFLDSLEGNGASIQWELKDSNEVSLIDPQRVDFDAQYTFEEAGTYTIVVFSVRDGVGEYQFQLWDVPEPQVSPAEVGSSIPDENGAIYNGTIDTPASAHHYQIPMQAGQAVYFDEHDSDGSQLNWSLLDVNGEIVVDVTRTDIEFSFVAEDEAIYTLVIKSTRDGVGAYEFQVWDIPDFSIIDYALGDTIEGEIITPAEAIGYTFEAMAGQVLYLESLDGNDSVHWELKDGNGNILLNPIRSDFDLGEYVVQTDGTYMLVVYSHRDGVGAYSMRVWDTSIQPDDFDVELGEIIRGNLDAGESLDFTLTINEELTLYFASQGQVGGVFHWSLYDADDNPIFDNEQLWLGNDDEYTLPAGTYRITVAGETDEDTGLYQFQVWDANIVDVFEYEIGDLVEEGLLGEGSGIISQPGEVDRYQFTVEEEGTFVFIGLLTADDNGFQWSLYDEAGNQIFENLGLWYGNELNPTYLPEGTFNLEVISVNGGTGYYGFQSWRVEAPDYFEIGIGAIISDGEPLEGAGNIETAGAIDSYLLILQEDAEVMFLAQTVSNASILWTLYDLDDEPIFFQEGLWLGNDLGPFALEAGAYNIHVRGETNNTGTYDFEIRSN